jgi:hypothetical protein
LVLRELLDAGLIVLPPEADEVATQCVWRTELVVAVPTKSPLAEPGPLPLRKLSGQAAVWLAREVNPALYRRVLDTLPQGLLPAESNPPSPNVRRNAGRDKQLGLNTSQLHNRVGGIEKLSLPTKRRRSASRADSCRGSALS